MLMRAALSCASVPPSLSMMICGATCSRHAHVMSPCATLGHVQRAAGMGWELGGGGGGGGGQGIVIFFLTYIILVVWIFFQVSVAVLLDHFLAARRGLVDLMGLRKHGFAGRGRILGKVRGRKKRGSLQY